MNGEASQRRLASGVTALTISVLIVKIIGLIYKIPLLKLLGTQGMGYFNVAYEIYALFFVISTAGLPVAVSIMVSENLALGRGRNVKKIQKTSFLVFFVFGLLGTLIMCFGASVFSKLLGDSQAKLSILAISPTVFFVCVSGAVRGYFQGIQNMKPTAVSQVVEAFGKLFLGMLFAALAKRAGHHVSVCAAFAVLGLAVGSLLSMLYLLLMKSISHVQHPNAGLFAYTDSVGRILYRLAFLAIPITLSSSLSVFTRIVDMGMILRRLQAIGYESSVSAAAYGCYSTLAIPLYNIPSSLVAGISLSLIPILTEKAENHDDARGSELVASSLKMCLFFSLPCAVGMAVFANPILSLLFMGEHEAVASATPMLALLAFSVCSSCLMGITNAILQAYRKATLPIVSMLVGTVLKIVSSYFLMGLPQIGIHGAAISTFFCNVAVVGMNLYFIDRFTRVRFDIFRLSLMPMLSSFLAVGGSLFVWHMLKNRTPLLIGLPVCIFLCVILYLWIGGRIGVYQAEDVKMLPFGKKALVLLYRFGFLKKERNKKHYEQGRYDQKASFERKV